LGNNVKIISLLNRISDDNLDNLSW